jgi:glutathione S-transferase
MTTFQKESIKLSYWGIPGRAEPIRLAFAVGNVEFEDIYMTGPIWGPKKESLKNSLAFVNLPLLEVNDSSFVESRSILRYAGRKANLYPSNDIDCLKVDESIDLLEEVYNGFSSTFSIKDETEKIAARKELLLPEGKISLALKKFSTYITSFGEDNFVVGDMMTIGDIGLFCTLSILASGMLDGIELNCLDSYPIIQSYRKKVGTHPKISAYYAKETEGLRFNGYKF